MDRGYEVHFIPPYLFIFEKNPVIVIGEWSSRTVVTTHPQPQNPEPVMHKTSSAFQILDNIIISLVLFVFFAASAEK
jgi:hypothetical protein